MQFPLIPTAVVRAPRAWGVYKPLQWGLCLLQGREKKGGYYPPSPSLGTGVGDVVDGLSCYPISSTYCNRFIWLYLFLLNCLRCIFLLGLFLGILKNEKCRKKKSLIFGISLVGTRSLEAKKVFYVVFHWVLCAV